MLWKQIWGAIKSAEVIIAVIIFFFVLIVINGLTLVLPAGNKYYSDQNFLNNIVANANTMIFDIAVVLVLNTLLLKIMERKRKIKDYLDEIDDFTGWASEEAIRRIRGNIFRLNKLGISEIDLSYHKLTRIQLKKVNLDHAKLHRAHLYCGNLEEASLKHTQLSETNLQNAWMPKCNFSSAFMHQVKLEGAFVGESIFIDTILWEANLNEAKLPLSNFRRAQLSYAKLICANLEGAIFKDADLEGAVLKESLLNNTIFQSANCQDAVFDKASLIGANMHGTNINMASFVYADIRNVKGIKEMYGISSADFTDAIMDDETREYLSKINPTVKPLEKTQK